MSFCAWWLVVIWGQMFVIRCLKKVQHVQGQQDVLLSTDSLRYRQLSEDWTRADIGDHTICFTPHSTKKPVTTMLTYPWKCTVLHCNHLETTGADDATL